MSVAFFHERPGQPRARVSCNGPDCAISEVFACKIDDEGQAFRKAVGLGWSLVKGRTYCPACEAKRKVVPMKPEPDGPADAEPRRPTREQRRAIMADLTECYDSEAGRYIGDMTDDQVAAILNVMPGWVAEVRREFFGDDGGNEAMAVTRDQIDAEITKLQAALKDVEKAAGECRVAIREAQDLAGKVEAIRKAVGPRVLKAAGA